MKKIIIFLGPPGSGKGTQAEKVAAQYGFAHLSSGDLLRNLLANPQDQAPEDLAEAQKMRTGILVGDWLVYKLIFSEIEKKISLGQGVVLDGAIRNLDQAKEFIKFFQEKKILDEVLVIYLRLSEEESLFRLTHRRVCSVCGLNIPYSEENKNLIICPKCGGEIKQRFDDKNEQVFKTRLLEQGEVILTPIFQEFKEIDGQMVKEMDGSKNIEDIFEEIKQIFKNAS